MSDQSHSALGVAALRLYAVVVLLIGAGLFAGGAYLLKLGGSPYYVLCGVAVMASGALLFLRRAEGVALYGLMFLATVVWAIWEAGADGWALMPRVIAPAVLGLVLLIPAVYRPLIRRRAPLSLQLVVALTVSAVALGVALRTFTPPALPDDPKYQVGTTTASAPTPSAPASVEEWHHWGNDIGGKRFSTHAQLTPANVANLELAWSFDAGPGSPYFQTTPLKVGETLYLCTGRSDVIALDAETGKQIWRFDAKLSGAETPHQVCRGVAYYKVPDATGVCAERIISTTVDTRLIALDTKTGELCPDFGTNGVTSLLEGMGEVTRGYYSHNAAPIVARGKIVLGGVVADNQYWGEPSGLIRAYDAVTGKLAWAWDMGVPDRIGAPPEGESYTHSTPNAWAQFSADESLGLVYIPTGNPAADYFGGLRRPFDEKYGSSLVALDVDSGRPRWHFQTVHHDIWDYDLPAQATLADYPGADGTVHAVILPTKRGELFVLDRATGEPIKRVDELPAPQRGGVPDDWVAPTQPFSVAMPSFRGTDLTEGDMWGITALDQLWCRIKFKEARYEGPNTPPGLTTAIAMPGGGGGMEWGGVAVDTTRNIIIVNTNQIPIATRLLPRAEADKLGIRPFTAEEAGHARIGTRDAMANTPYANLTGPFFSPLQVPCVKPPYGELSAIDLVSGKLIWTQPFGSARDQGPFGVKSLVPLTVGTVNAGGGLVTESGLLFIGATQDRYFRAYETATGKELWRNSLPYTAAATPMTYMSSPSGRQFVVIAAGTGTYRGPLPEHNFIRAYALPKSAETSK